MPKKICLTSKNSTLTILNESGVTQNVDATAKRLLNQLRDLERESWRISEKIRAIQMALKLAGVRPATSDFLGAPDAKEAEYAVRQPFAELKLTDACEQVLKDYAERWLTKSQVEWLIARGGYKSSAKDPKNSVEMTLRRIAADNRCEVERVRGSHGNRYKWILRSPRHEDKEDLVSS